MLPGHSGRLQTRWSLLQFSCSKSRTGLREWRPWPGPRTSLPLPPARSESQRSRWCWQPWGSWRGRGDWWFPPRSRGWSDQCWADTAGSPPQCWPGGRTDREAGTGLGLHGGHSRAGDLCPRHRTSTPCWTLRSTGGTETSPGWYWRRSHTATDLDIIIIKYFPHIAKYYLLLLLNIIFLPLTI